MLIPPRAAKIKNNQVLILKSPTPAEAQLLIDHLTRVFKNNYKNFNRPADYWETLPVEKEAIILKEHAEAHNKFMLSAYHEGKIVGNFGLFGFDFPFGKYSARFGLGIEDEFQNMGLGTALLNCGMEEAKKMHIHSLELSVRTFNGPAIALYEKCGFRRVGEMKEIAFIDGEYFDEYIYQKIL